MKNNFILLLTALILSIFSCETVEQNVERNNEELSRNSTNFNVNFQHAKTINTGGSGSAEISAYDKNTKKLFVVDASSKRVTVWNIANLDSPVELAPITLGTGAPNSVAVSKGLVAVAIEADVKQDPGFVNVYDAETQNLVASYQVGALPDMVAFSPNGQFLVSANEGEPNDDYTVDPKGSISIIEVATGNLTTLYFDAFNDQKDALVAQGLRVFGPGATLAMDLEPEYVAISDNSNTAWITLQENNGMAKVNLKTKTIEAIYPLGFKDYNQPGNEIDPSDRDDIKSLNNWPVFGMYQPDAIKYLKVNGVDYIISANEGDARDYDTFEEEARIKNLELDPAVFPNFEFLQQDANLGRLEVTTTLGDANNDGKYEALYSFGARSFSVWTGNGILAYDSGSSIAETTLALTPDRFNDSDGRSDAKGAEPETVEILNVQGNKYLLFVALERNDQIMVYDISTPTSPQFLSILSHPGDDAPEGLLTIPSKDSPTGRDLLVVSNEGSGTVTFYENMQ